MKPSLEHLDKFRIPEPRSGHMGGPDFGAFAIPRPGVNLIGRKHHFIVLASSGHEDMPWDHVSFHGRFFGPQGEPMYFTPTWSDTCWIKEQFFLDTECAMQLLVPKSDHINVHEHTLHLWRPHNIDIPRPPAIAV